MAMTRTGMLAAGVVAAFAAQPWEEAFAACNATVNGRPMSPELCALATRVYGSVVPGHYWVDYQGNWGRGLTSMPRATCCVTSVAAAARHGPGGAAGGDGEFTYFNDPDTGGSVMTGGC